MSPSARRTGSSRSLAAVRGFPDADRYDEQLAALSVHHAHHVHGYRRVHRVASVGAGGQDGDRADTEEMRESLVEARALFDDLMKPTREDKVSEKPAMREETARNDGSGSHLPWAFNRHHAKGS